MGIGTEMGAEMDAGAAVEVGPGLEMDDKLIAYLEDLSCLTLSDAEKLRLTGDLQEIIDGMALLRELDTSGVPERSHPFDAVNAFREDVAQPSFERELILQTAPNRSADMFLAPSAIS